MHFHDLFCLMVRCVCLQTPEDEATEMSEATEATDATDISEASDQDNNKKAKHTIFHCHSDKLMQQVET